VSVDEAAEQKQQKRKAASERLCSELALLTTLLLHAGLLYGFKVQTCVGRHVAAVSEPDCILVSPATELPQRPGPRDWEKQIHAWCFLADPTLMTLPDDTVGFGEVRRNERSLPVTEAPVFQCTVALIEERQLDELTLSSALASVDHEVSAKWPLAELPRRETPPTCRLPDGLLWRLADGTVLRDVPDVAEEDVREALAEGSSPSEASRIEIDRTGEFGRIHVRRGCGNPRLDLLLVRALRKRMFRSEFQGESATAKASSDCIPALGKQSAFEVEWRLARLEPTAEPEPGQAPGPEEKKAK